MPQALCKPQAQCRTPGLKHSADRRTAASTPWALYHGHGRFCTATSGRWEAVPQVFCRSALAYGAVPAGVAQGR
eukprot:9461426-Alexandrium_andersonii.AAC.1